jgi:hypothetical protein
MRKSVGLLTRVAKGGGGGGCVQGGCLDLAVIELHGAETLDLEAETTRKKNLRNGLATSASAVVNTSVLGLGFKT